MKIQSRFRDYYDYVAHIYGGGDPKNTYVRDIIVPDRVTPLGEKFEETAEFREPEFELWVPGDYQLADGSVQQFFGISIAGKVYIVTRVHNVGTWSYTNNRYEGDHTEPWKIATYGDLSKRQIRAYRQSLPSGREPDHVIRCGVPSPEAGALSKRLKAPVFKFDNHYSTRVYGRCPLLSEYGIPPVLEPEQAYQEISMFLMSVVNESPDSMPRAEMTNVQKVESHGFDKRISFRHRK
jgi:hypothetical protein